MFATFPAACKICCRASWLTGLLCSTDHHYVTTNIAQVFSFQTSFLHEQKLHRVTLCSSSVGFGRPRFPPFSSFFTLPFLSTSTYHFLPVYCNRVPLQFRVWFCPVVFLERMCLKVSIDKLPRYCTAPGEPPQQVPLLLHESQAIPLDPAA